jgi:hypothetical protein
MRKIFLSKDLEQIFIELSLACLLIIFASCFILNSETINIAKKKKDYFFVISAFPNLHRILVFHSKDLINWQQIGPKQKHESQLSLPGQQSNGGISLLTTTNFPPNQTCHTIITNSKDLFLSGLSQYGLKRLLDLIHPSFSNKMLMF